MREIPILPPEGVSQQDSIRLCVSLAHLLKSFGPYLVFGNNCEIFSWNWKKVIIEFYYYLSNYLCCSIGVSVSR